ncbi:MAG: ArnT family glycosyltransferase [Bacillota bacterium]
MPNLNIVKKHPYRVLLILLCIAHFALNAYLVLSMGDQFLLGDLETMNNDDVKYLRSAWTLLETGRFTYHDPNTLTVFIMPGHTVVLSGLMMVFGRAGGVTAFRLFQALLQSLSIILTFVIGVEIFDRKAALIACLISLFYLPNYASTGLLLTDVEFKFVFLLLVMVSLRAVKNRSTGWYALGGLLWGLACLFRPTIALYPAAILIVWLIERYSVAEMARFATVAAVVLSLVMLPWWLRNASAFHRFIPLTLSSGNPFLQGTYIEYDQSRDYMPYTEPLDGKDAVRVNEIEMTTARQRLTVYASQHPMAYIRWYTVGKTWYLWYDSYYWKEVLGVPRHLVDKSHRVLLVLGALGALATVHRRRNTGALFLLSIIAYFTLSHLPFYTFARYAYPLMPFVILFASHAAMALAMRIARGRPGQSEREALESAS